MSGSAAAAWQKAIRALQHCCSTTAGLLPESREAEAAYHIVMRAAAPLYELPAFPKAVWKKLVLQLKVPSQLGAAISSAAEHGWRSPAMGAAGDLLFLLLGKFPEAGIGNLNSSIRQQLQQSGMLQHFAAMMVAMAADQQAEAAALAAGGAEAAAGADVELLVANTPHVRVRKVMYMHWAMAALWGCHESGALDDDAIAWLADPSGHAVADMQLQTAALQHVSAVVLHVLPAVRQRAPQQAEALMRGLSVNLQEMRAGTHLVSLVLALAQGIREGIPGSAADRLQQLLLLPPVAPLLATLLVLEATCIRRAVSVDSYSTQERSSGSSSASSSSASSSSASSSSASSSSASSSSCGAGRRGATAAAVSSSCGAASAAPTACELQLLQLLGLAPEVVACLELPGDLSHAAERLSVATALCARCYDKAASRLEQGNSSAAGQGEAWQQRQQCEQQLQLLLLLPAVLLPCASSLLSPSTQHLQQQKQQQQQGEKAMQQLLLGSDSLLQLSVQLCGYPSPLAAPPPAAWVQELLGVVLQLADQLLYQQPPATAPGAAAATPGSKGSSTSSSRRQSQQQTRAVCACRLLSLLLAMVLHCQELQRKSISNGNSGRPDGTAAAASPVAARFVEYGTALEAALRVVTEAVQCGVNDAGLPVDVGSLPMRVLLLPPCNTDPVLVQHMGLCGPVALAREQRQLYSLLSTVLKLGRCTSAGAQVCIGEEVAGSCCLAAGQAAVWLLKVASPTGAAGSTAQQSLLSAAAGQLPAVDYLPSLVIFGRCCLQWAEQLQRQTPDLLLLASGALQQGERRFTLLHIHSAAQVCHIAGRWQVWTFMAGNSLASLVAKVSAWVAGLESPAALTQLEAAGCGLQQLQQQLEALLAAQQGTQQGLTEASLAALVQQLQATGAMLSNIAVPHFCNNPGCGNISGPTEVQLVSGRSCLCAGCLTARYCGRDCQRAAWKQHRPVCKALAAAAAAVAAAAATAAAVV